MKVGLANFMQSAPGTSDAEVYRRGLRIADQAEDLGFDSIWGVEHHFSDMSMIPDVLQFLTFMAGRTRRVQLGAGVVVLPWHNPIRVAEQIAALDLLSDGRLLVGLGRGSAAHEYAGFSLSMEDSRERFREGAEIVKLALRGEPFTYEGAFYRVPGVGIRPRPEHSFEGRLYGAAVSPKSAQLMARLGLGVMVAFPAKGWAHQGAEIDKYRAQARAAGRRPDPVIGQVFVYCGESERDASRATRKYMGELLIVTEDHYGRHKIDAAGFEHYRKLGTVGKVVPDVLKRRHFVGLQVAGTPEQCLRRIATIRDKAHVDHLICGFYYGTMPVEEAERSMRLFASEVLPRVQGEATETTRACRMSQPV